MPKHTLTINHPNDERVEYFLDGTPIGTANHDDHGWAGMELADSLVMSFAEAFNLKIVETYKEEGYDDEGEEE